MHSNLTPSLAYILISEGGFAIRATEPGGAVNMGVSMNTFRLWRAVHHEPEPTIEDLRWISQAEVEAIYGAMYASLIAFDSLPTGLDYCVLDAAVNDGVNWALVELAKVVGFTIPGKWAHPGPIAVAAAVWSQANPLGTAIEQYCDDRLKHKEVDKADEWPRFHAGWSIRIDQVRHRSIAMAAA